MTHPRMILALLAAAVAASVLPGVARADVPPTAVEVGPSRSDLGALPVGSSWTERVTLLNSRAQAVTFTGVRNSDSAEITVGDDTCFDHRLLAGKTCSFLMTFRPGAVGARSGSVSHTYDTAGVATYDVTATGVAGALSISQSRYDFGTLQTGSAAAHEITISNDSASPVTFDEPEVGDPLDFSADLDGCGAGTTLAPGATCSFFAAFSPAGTGLSSGTVTHRTRGGASVVVDLVGVGRPGGAPSIAFSAAALSVGVTAVGTSRLLGTASLRNESGAPVTLAPVQRAGSDAFVTAPGCDAGAVLQPGGSCAFQVFFQPRASGVQAATLVYATMSGALAALAVSGTAAAPSLLSFEQTGDTSFGTVTVGTAVSHVFMLRTDDGSGDLVTRFRTSDPDEFSVDRQACLATTLTIFSRCPVVVTFRPQATGPRSGTITFTSSGGSATLALTGDAVSPGGGRSLRLGEGAFDYGVDVVGAPAASHDFTVSNVGQAPVVFTGSSSSSPDDLAVRGGTCIGQGAVPAGGTCTFAVMFQPGAAGPRSGTVRLVTAGGDAVRASLTGTGILPITADTPSFDFGAVVVTREATHAFTLTNHGAKPVTLTRGVFPPGFAPLSDTCSTAPLAAGASCVVNVAFRPAAARVFSGVVSFSYRSGSVDVHLAGAGATPLAIDPPAYNFGDVPLTTVGSRTFTLTNTGLDAVLPQVGTIAAPFAAGAADCMTHQLAPGAGCSFTVTFTPAGIGEPVGTLAVADDVGGSVTVGVTGRGVPQIAVVGPSAFDFGKVPYTNTPAHVFTFRNVGTKQVAVTLKKTESAPFRVASDHCTGSLRSGATCEINVEFAPTKLRPETRSIGLDAASGGSASVQVDGTGVPPIEIDATTYDFGDVGVGAASQIHTFTVTNRGTATARVTSSSTDRFGFTGSCGTIFLPPGQSCSLNVQFQPLSPHPVSGNLYVKSELFGGREQDTAAVIVALTGNGTRLALDEKRHDFGSVLIGTELRRTFTFTNYDSASVAFTGLASSSPAGFEIAASSCSQSSPLPAGSSCAITAGFRPTVTGPRSTTLTLTTSDGDTFTIDLLGSGTKTSGSLSLSETAFDFGTVAVGTSSHAFTITNTGDSPVTISGRTGPTQPGLSIIGESCTGPVPPPLPPGGTCGFTVRFAALTPGPRHDLVTYLSDAGQVALTLDASSLGLDVPADRIVEAAGSFGAAVTFTVFGSGTVSCDHPSGSLFPLGVTTVTCTSVNPSSLTVTKHFDVTVLDTTPPTLDTPGEIVVSADRPSGVASVGFRTVAFDLVDRTVPMSCVPASGSAFPVGTTQVACQAVDAHGNQATGTFAVVVRSASDQIADLQSFVGGMSVDADVSQAVLDKLGSAAQKVARRLDACPTMTSVVSYAVTKAANGVPSKLSVSQAEQLVAGSNMVLGALGCLPANSALPGAEQDLLELMTTIADLGASPNEATSLTNKVRDAANQVVSGTSACGTLSTLVAQINADTGKKNGLTPAQAAPLLAATAAIQAKLGC